MQRESPAHRGAGAPLACFSQLWVCFTGSFHSLSLSLCTFPFTDTLGLNIILRRCNISHRAGTCSCPCVHVCSTCSSLNNLWTFHFAIYTLTAAYVHCPAVRIPVAFFFWLKVLNFFKSQHKRHSCHKGHYMFLRYSMLCRGQTPGMSKRG